MIQITQPMKDVLEHAFTRKAIWFSNQIDCDAWQSNNDWRTFGSPSLIWPVAQYRDELTGVLVIGCLDAAYGMLYFWDGDGWICAKECCVTPCYVFMADYYGFPNGVIFAKVSEGERL